MVGLVGRVTERQAPGRLAAIVGRGGRSPAWAVSGTKNRGSSRGSCPGIGHAGRPSGIACATGVWPFDARPKLAVAGASGLADDSRALRGPAGRPGVRRPVTRSTKRSRRHLTKGSTTVYAEPHSRAREGTRTEGGRLPARSHRDSIGQFAGGAGHPPDRAGDARQRIRRGPHRSDGQHPRADRERPPRHRTRRPCRHGRRRQRGELDSRPLQGRTSATASSTGAAPAT